jgi:hypothetical protein
MTITELLHGEKGSPMAIEMSEKAGQIALVKSQHIPIQGSAALVELGFQLGDRVDDLFIEATLPEGWTREGSEHAMWSYILDAEGNRRVSVFYKAAFYDRDAFCRVIAPSE